MIEGVIVKKLISHGDKRGFFREVIRETDPLFYGGTFGQWSHSKMTKNVVKAWHFHHLQTDWWYVPIGAIQTVLIDNRPESATYQEQMKLMMGEPEIMADTEPLCVKIPPGVLHGCKVISDTAHLLYVTSHSYNPLDEGRLPFNSPDVQFNWGSGVITAENDRRTFIPPHPRNQLDPRQSKE